MAIRIGQMEITFAPRGILGTLWMKPFFHEVRPETVDIRNVKNQPPPADTSIAVFDFTSLRTKDGNTILNLFDRVTGGSPSAASWMSTRL
jgi:hypothetical protein